MMIKIAVLTNAFPPRDHGGSARIAGMQVEMLQRAGYEVRVWTPMVPWLTKPVWARFFYHLLDLRAHQETVHEVLAWQPDVLVTHNLTGCGFATPRYIQARGVRWVHMLHDIQLFEPSGQLYRLKPITFWQLFWAALRACAFQKPDVVISPTRWLIRQHRYRFLLRSLEVRGEVLPNPGPPINPVSRTCVRMERLRLLFVGHVSRQKGSDVLLALVHALRVPFELHIVGDGPDIEMLRRASPDIVFHGVCDAKTVLSHMRDADILLVPSRIYENQPTVILEAASVGLPVIASDRDGIVETLGMAAAYMICPPDRIMHWCKAIERLYDPQVYRHQAHLMHHVAEQHDYEEYAQRFIKLLTSNR